MNSIQSCAGGWCSKRDHCAHYHAASPDQTPSERLCPPGMDGAGLQTLEDNDMTRPYLSADERRKQALALIQPEGISSKDLAVGMGYAKSENAARIVEALLFAGMVQSCRVRASDDPTNRAWVTMYFPTIGDRDAFVARRKQQTLERTKQRKKETAPRMPYYIKRNAQRKAARADRVKARAEKVADDKALRLAEAEQRKQRERLDREAAAAAKAREKAEAKKAQARLKAETKAAGQLAKLKPAKPAPVVIKPRGPAFLAGPADASRAKVTKVEAPPSRYSASEAPSVISSSQCRPWAEAVAA